MANTLSPDEKDIYKIVRAVRDLFEGRSNAIGSFTLKPSAGSTTVKLGFFGGPLTGGPALEATLDMRRRRRI